MFEVKKLLPYLTLVAVISGGFAWIYGNFTHLSAHERLERRVENNELQQAYRAALQNFYFWKEQRIKYPNDQEILQKFEESEKRLRIIESHLQESA